MAKKNSIVHKYHIFLIYLSVMGYLGCFHILAIMNSTTINMSVQCFYYNLTYNTSDVSLGMVLFEEPPSVFHSGSKTKKVFFQT
jgi:hypothetical protein